MEEPLQDAELRGILHRPEKESGLALALAHGAGSNCNAPLLVAVARAFCGAGWLVLRYDLPFRREKPKGPPSPALAGRDRDGIRRAAERLAGMSRRVILGGHSYGGRQSAMLAASDPALAAGLLLLSYPLHPPGRPESPRTAYFPELRTPALFVHGSADPFGGIEELRSAISLVPDRTDLLPVPGAGHDLARAADLFPAILARLTALISAA